MKTGLLESPAKVESLGIRMENVCAATLCHMARHIFEGSQKEGEELFIRHTVIPDLLAISRFTGLTVSGKRLPYERQVRISIFL